MSGEVIQVTEPSQRDRTTPGTFEAPSAYKRPEVGEIPEGWRLLPIGRMGEVITGKALAVNAPGSQRPYLRTKNVFDGRIDIEDVLTMPMTDAQFEHFKIVPGDVLLNEGQSLELVGRCSIYQDEYPEPCAIQNQLLRFRARTEVSPDFASQLFRYCQQTGVFARIALQTTSIAHLGGTRFERLLLPWPEKEQEQRAIAESLSNVDELIGALERLITKKRAIKLATVQQLLTGKIRLPGYKEPWRCYAFDEITHPRSERVDPRLSGPQNFCVELEHIEQGTGRLLGNTSAEVGSSIKNVFHSQDVLFGKLRAYLRKFWLAERSGVCSTEIWVLVANSGVVTPEFLFQIIRTDMFIEAASTAYGTHMPRSDWNVVKTVPIELPSVTEQAAIATVLADMDSAITALEQRRDKTIAIKQGMMQQLLTGRTRLV